MKRDTIALIIALVCGAAAFGLIYNHLKQANQPQNQFVVAAQELPKGKVLTPEDLTVSEPLKNVPQGKYFTQIQDLIGTELQKDIPQGKLIGRSLIKKIQAKLNLPVRVDEDETLPVPPSMRALTLGTQELENIPQNLKPGEYVDTLGSVAIANNQREIRTVLHAVLVLSVQRSEKKQIEAVTIALATQQVETLLNSLKFGKVRLVMAPKTDDGSAWSNSGSIEIIRGTQRERKIT